MATVWTGDPARGHRVAQPIKAGTVGINMPYTAFPGIPFGGYKQSGFGRELGLEALDAVPRDEERPRLHEPEAVQPVRPLARHYTPVTMSDIGPWLRASRPGGMIAR